MFARGHQRHALWFGYFYFNHPSNSLEGGITASIQAGAFVGSLLTGLFLADALGRKRTLLCGSVLFTIGIAITAASNSVSCLIAGRIINGIANGCCAIMVPLWQRSEVASSRSSSALSTSGSFRLS